MLCRKKSYDKRVESINVLEGIHMKNRVGEKVKSVVAKMAVETAVQVTQMPNQFCACLLGEPKPKMALVSTDYKQLKQFVQNQKSE